jgi:tetratricopeptide (TPR) repeat protein
MLGSNDPFDENYTVTTSEEREFARRLLDRAAENVETELADQPEVLADIQEVLGTTYTSLGFRDVARPHLEASLALRRELFGNHHPDVATALEELGELTALVGAFEESKSLFEEALEIRRSVLGERHPGVRCRGGGHREPRLHDADRRRASHGKIQCRCRSSYRADR